MPLKLFHTADVHLGLKFGDYPEEVSRRLREARFETLASMVARANQERCDLFVVGGDLFDTPRVAKRDVERAAQILGQFEGAAVAVLPGNHDYITQHEDDLWKAFMKTRQDRLVLLAEKKAYSLKPFDLDACLYAAPCQNQKHSKSHAVGWIGSEERAPSTKFHIGVAHGSFEGLSCDIQGEYYPMKRDDLLRTRLDLWLMGHIHVQFPVKPGASDRIFYPGTPEPDGFDCDHGGVAWMIELDDQKSVQATSVSTGKFRFRHEEAQVASLQDLDSFRERQEPATLMKLAFRGALSREDYTAFHAAADALKEKFLYLEQDRSLLTTKLTPEDIEREFTRDSFGYRLLSELARTQGDAEALQLAYDLIRPKAISE